MGIWESIAGTTPKKRLMQVMVVVITAAFVCAVVYGLVTGGGHEPFDWIGEDTLAETVIRCPSAVDTKDAETQAERDQHVTTNEEVVSWFAPYAEDCWPVIPVTEAPDVVDDLPCDGWAERGELRIHSCRESMPEGQMPCETADASTHRSGALYAQFEGGQIVAADMYLEPDLHRKARTGEHEVGHYLGIANEDHTDGRLSMDAFGSHTSAATHLMSKKGDGTDRRWMNRCEGGDWPYGK